MKNKRWIKAIAIASCCLALTAAAVAILHSNWDRWFNAQQQAGIVMKLDGDAEEWTRAACPAEQKLEESKSLDMRLCAFQRARGMWSFPW